MSPPSQPQPRETTVGTASPLVSTGPTAAMAAGRRHGRLLLALGVGISLLLAGLVSFYASSAPDGLNKVASDLGFDLHAQASATAGSPLADYQAAWVSDERVAVGLAGIVGILVTGALAFTLFLWLGRRHPVDPDEPEETHDPLSAQHE